MCYRIDVDYLVKKKSMNRVSVKHDKCLPKQFNFKHIVRNRQIFPERFNIFRICPFYKVSCIATQSVILILEVEIQNHNLFYFLF